MGNSEDTNDSSRDNAGVNQTRFHVERLSLGAANRRARLIELREHPEMTPATGGMPIYAAGASVDFCPRCLKYHV